VDVDSPDTIDPTIRSRCVGSDVALPGVAYVQNVPAAQATTCPANGNNLGYPVAGDITRYGCRDGDAFVSGVLSGRLTIAAENDVIVVDDTTYQSFGSGTVTDMLGLVANGFVKVYHPISCDDDEIFDDGVVRTCEDLEGSNLPDPRNPPDGFFRDPTIHAAILALNHSFIVQHYNNGNQLGTLTVFGAIGQAWRGPVGLIGDSGYVKSYNYDGRLQVEGPPSFIDPVQSPWRLRSFAEIRNPQQCAPPTVVSTCRPP
jgi:hypothetical protein